VKYYVLLPSVMSVGSELDNVQWETILRSVSAQRAYRWLNGRHQRSRDIADFLILDRRLPRSLAFCYHKLRDNLNYLAVDHGTRPPATTRDRRSYRAPLPVARHRRGLRLWVARVHPEDPRAMLQDSAARSRSTIGSPVAPNEPMRLKISHQTRYAFDHPVHYGLQQLRKTPKSRAGKVLSWETRVEGGQKQLGLRRPSQRRRTPELRRGDARGFGGGERAARSNWPRPMAWSDAPRAAPLWLFLRRPR
jgi:hypothetical protein